MGSTLLASVLFLVAPLICHVQPVLQKLSQLDLKWKLPFQSSDVGSEISSQHFTD